MKENLLILGAGGHGHVVREAAEAMGIFEKIDFLDDNAECMVSIGLCVDNGKFKDIYKYAFPAFGNNLLRMDWMERLMDNAFIIPAIVHPSSYISPSATIYPGTIINAKAAVNTNAVVESGCIINVGAIVDHDAHVGRGCHISSGAIIKSLCSVKAFSTVDCGTVFTRDEISSKNKKLPKYSFEVGV